MSTRRRGQIIPKGPDKWLVRLHLGQRKYLGITVSGSKRDAEQVLTQKLREMDTSLSILPQRLTVDEFFDRWLVAKEPQVAPRTFQSYRDLLRLHVRPTLGTYRLDKVSPLLLQDLITRLSASLSPRMVQYTATVVSQALKTAVQWRLLPVSPAVYLQLPKRTRQERRILTAGEVRTLFSATVDSPWHALWVLLLTTGMRPHEALALQWGDIDTQGRIHVARGLRQVKPGQYEVSETKTSGSRRTLGVPTDVIEVLQRHRVRQAKLSPWVFVNANGNPWDLSKVRKAWYRDLKAAGLSQVTLYTARHTHLSHLVMATGSLKVAQHRGGHSSIRLTGDTYTHLLDETHEETTEVIQKMLFK